MLVTYKEFLQAIQNIRYIVHVLCIYYMRFPHLDFVVLEHFQISL